VRPVLSTMIRATPGRPANVRTICAMVPPLPVRRPSVMRVLHGGISPGGGVAHLHGFYLWRRQAIVHVDPAAQE
jgi:hypothetical protein